MIYRNAHLISPGLEIEDGFLEVEEGIIIAIGPMPKCPSGESKDIEGKMLLPGFIDIHAHGADGADVCDTSVESLQHIAERKLQEGVTTWLPTTLTLAEDRLVEVVSTVAEWAPSAPLSVPGIHLEGPFINAEQAGAQNLEYVRLPSGDELRRLHGIFPAKLLSLAPDVDGAVALVRTATELGVRTSAAHSKATHAELRAAMDAGLTHLTHFGNAMTPLHHRELGMIGGGLLEDDLMLEVIGDGVHLSDDFLRLLLKVVPIERLILITDSVAASWQDDGEFDFAGLAVTIRDGVARLADGTLAGSALKFNEGFQRMAELSGRPLSELIAITGLNQARSLGLHDRGELVIGKRADLVVLDSDFEVVPFF